MMRVFQVLLESYEVISEEEIDSPDTHNEMEPIHTSMHLVMNEQVLLMSIYIYRNIKNENIKQNPHIMSQS